MEAPGQNHSSGECEPATQSGHGEWREFGAYAMELVLDQPEEGNGAEAEGESEFRAFSGRA